MDYVRLKILLVTYIVTLSSLSFGLGASPARLHLEAPRVYGPLSLKDKHDNVVTIDRSSVPSAITVKSREVKLQLDESEIVYKLLRKIELTSDGNPRVEQYAARPSETRQNSGLRLDRINLDLDDGPDTHEREACSGSRTRTYCFDRNGQRVCEDVTETWYGYRDVTRNNSSSTSTYRLVLTDAVDEPKFEATFRATEDYSFPIHTGPCIEEPTSRRDDSPRDDYPYGR